MHCLLEKKEIQSIKSTNIVQQTAFWARVKYQQGLQPLAFTISATDDLLDPTKKGSRKIQDDLLVFIRYISTDSCFAYVPYGPKVQPDYENYGLFLEELSEVLKPHLPAGCFLIRYDLPWESQWAKESDYYDEKGSWKGLPSVNNQEFRLNFKTHNWNLLKSPSDILPTNTFFLDLNQNEDRLMQRMKPKTRYNIRLSLRKGIAVKEYGMDKLDHWFEIYKETALRNNITLHHKEYFRSVLSQQKNNESGKVQTRLLMADLDGEYLAALFLILSKNRGTYLYGASSSQKRNYMATYALQWEAIRLAQQAGCKEYDMFGAAPNANSAHPLYGLYRFKSGFGGHLFHRMGCWDYPINQSDYQSFKALEYTNQSYHTS